MAIVIPEDDLGAVEKGSAFPAYLVRTRATDQELPIQIELVYIDGDNDYNKGIATQRRIITEANANIRITVPIVEDVDFANKAVDILLYNAWLERNTFTFQIPFKYIYLDPADVVEITYNNVTYYIRITDISYNTPGHITCRGVAHESSVYTSFNTGASSIASSPTSGIVIKGPTVVEMLNAPLLRQADEGASYYIAFSGYYDAWSAGVLYRSTDGGVTWSDVATIDSAAQIGTAASAMASATYLDVWDSYASVTVTFTKTPTIANSTASAVLNGANAMMIGDEIVAPVSVIDNGDGTYTFREFLRGLKGTDVFVNSHTDFESVVVLDENTMAVVTEDDNAIGTTALYKAVTAGQSLQEATAFSFTNTGAALKPYAPAHLYAHRDDNDWFVNWVRRTRYGGEWRDGVNAANSEDREIYGINFYASSDFSSVVYAIATTSTPSVTFTSAQQVSAFADSSVQATLHVGVFQISDTVGAGHIRYGSFNL